MANKKISALTAATTPLAGTEVLPIVQSGATVKVAVSDLTAGRAVSVSSLTTTGLEAKMVKTAYSLGGSASVTFTVTLPSNADWTPGVLRIEAAATDRNTAGFCSAWWQYVNIVLNANSPITTLSDSGGTIASYTVVVTGNSGTGSQVLTIVVTALLLDYLTCNLSISGALGITSIT